MSFFRKLAKASEANNSLLCVGLDPELHLLLPDVSLPRADPVVDLNRLLVEATAPFACAYKPNVALYESLGKEGISALEQTLKIIRETSPETPIIGDAKRADTANCGPAYAYTLFQVYKFDAVTVHPYMGYDTVSPYLEHKEKGVFILCRSSNPGGKDLQELRVMEEGDQFARPLYEHVAELANRWNTNHNVGLVVGATYPEQISRIRDICPNMTFLIPGVGPQGGDIQETVRNALDCRGSGFIITASRQIMNAAKTPKGKYSLSLEAEKRVGREARRLRNEINKHRAHYAPVNAELEPERTVVAQSLAQ